MSISKIDDSVLDAYNNSFIAFFDDKTNKINREEDIKRIKHIIMENYVFPIEKGMTLSPSTNITNEYYKEYFNLSDNGIPIIPSDFSDISIFYCSAYQAGDEILLIYTDKVFDNIKEYMLKDWRMTYSNYKKALGYMKEDEAYIIEKAELIFTGKIACTTNLSKVPILKALLGEYKQVFFEEDVIAFIMRNKSKPPLDEIKKIYEQIKSSDIESIFFGMNSLIEYNIYDCRGTTNMLLDEKKNPIIFNILNSMKQYRYSLVRHILLNAIMLKDKYEIHEEEKEYIEYILERNLLKDIDKYTNKIIMPEKKIDLKVTIGL